MNTSQLKWKDIDAYHAAFPLPVRKRLAQLRQAIRQAAPQATETISYGMPSFRQNKVLVYYAANKAHIGFYPTPGPIVLFKKELTPYQTSTGAIQFPFDKPLPLPLIKKLVKFRVEEDAYTSKAKAAAQKTKLDGEIDRYNRQQGVHRTICDRLAAEINKQLKGAENKIWHRHPVWFLNGNPIVGYSQQKQGIRLMFWSGQGFDEEKLDVRGQKFKDASIFYSKADDINARDLTRWLKKAETIQWDYKNLVKRKGRLVRL